MHFEPEKRPAGAFWVDKIVFCQKVVPQGPFGQTKLSPKAAYWYYGGGNPRGTPGRTPGGGAAPPESQDGGTEGGQPEAISQPVDPGGVGGFI